MDKEELEKLESLTYEPSGAIVEANCYDIYYSNRVNVLYATPCDKFRPIVASVRVDKRLTLDDNLNNIVEQIRLSLYG